MALSYDKVTQYSCCHIVTLGLTPWKLGFWWHTQSSIATMKAWVWLIHNTITLITMEMQCDTLSHKLSIINQAHYIYIYRTQSSDCPTIKTFLKMLENFLFPKLLNFTLTITPTPIFGKTSPLLLLPMPSTCSTLLDNLCPFWCRLHYVYIQM
jgi:hypothetical protein